jgi:hypothetical protein
MKLATTAERAKHHPLTWFALGLLLGAAFDVLLHLIIARLR